MNIAEVEKMEAALMEAFEAAIEKVGIATLKATSLFGSNERVELKKAA